MNENKKGFLEMLARLLVFARVGSYLVLIGLLLAAAVVYVTEDGGVLQVILIGGFGVLLFGVMRLGIWFGEKEILKGISK